MENCTNQTKVFLNNKFAATINTKRKEALRICYAIKEYFYDLTGYELPRYSQEFWAKKDHYFNHEAYGLDLEKAHGDLVRMYYGLLYCNVKTEAIFPNFKEAKTQLLACKYSKHRLDPIWNFRKSRLIRKIYTKYLNDTQIHKEYHPVHLVLTVPHGGGKWANKRVYIQEIIAAFNKLRKTDIWKKCIYAGEYGVEVKPSKNNGLHIHIHSLCFQHPEFTVNEVRDLISAEWKHITKNDSTRSGIHYETLYYHKKNEGGRGFEMHAKWVNNEGNWEQVVAKKKYYINSESTSDEMILGIMECVKYHFKHDIFAIDGCNGVDVNFLSEVCRETKHKRLYSRFGAFYRVKELNFNLIEDKAEKEPDNEHDVSYLIETETKEDVGILTIESVMEGITIVDRAKELEQLEHERHQFGRVCSKEEMLVNPWTFEKACKSEYYLTVSLQNSGLYKTGNANFDKYKPENDFRFYIRDDIDFTTAWKKIMQGKILEVLDHESIENYEREYMYATVEEQLNM